MANLLNLFFDSDEEDKNERKIKVYKIRGEPCDDSYRQLYRIKRENVDYHVNCFLPGLIFTLFFTVVSTVVFIFYTKEVK